MAKKKKEKKEQCPINFKPLEGTILKYKGKKEKITLKSDLNASEMIEIQYRPE